MDLLTRIDSVGRTVPQRPAYVTATGSLCYGELARRSDILAAQLTAMLPHDGSPVVLHGHKEPEMLIAFLGCVKCGHPYVPLDNSFPAHRVRRILDTARSPLTLTPDRVAKLTDGSELTRSTAQQPRPVTASDPFYVMFTSGSTGEPKGVVITVDCVTSFVSGMLAALSPIGNAPEVFLNQAIFAFDLSVMDLYLALATGSTVFAVTGDEATNPARLYKSLMASNVTTWVSTPTFAQLCLAEPGFERAMLPTVRRFVFCGETLAPQIAAELLDRFPGAEVWNAYGPTEATVATTAVSISAEILTRYSPLPVGRPIGTNRVVVLDEGGEVVAEGERGEIVIAGPNVSPGYLHRPDLTERAFFQLDGAQAYRTGDWGHFQDGMLFFGGRRDEQIKLHGYRIELGDVEANLRALGEVRDAAVLPKLKDGSTSSLTAFVVLSRDLPGSDFEVAATIRARLAERLPAHMLPRKFVILASFPMTANGKIDRRRLAELLG